MDESSVIDSILRESRTIAVVGLSDKPDRPSYGVAKYLQTHGYRIVPVNPALTEVLGERSYPDLASIPGPDPVDVVDIFRRAEDVPSVVEAAIAKGAKAVWMQEGIIHSAAAERARSAGLQVVMNRCMKKSTKRARRATNGRNQMDASPAGRPERRVRPEPRRHEYASRRLARAKRPEGQSTLQVFNFWWEGANQARTVWANNQALPRE